MNTYRFYDTDDTGCEEYDISGAEYCCLLNICYKYCATVSFQFRNCFSEKKHLLDEFDIFRTSVHDYVLKNYGYSFARYRSGCYDYEVRHYKLCTQILALLLSITDGFFEKAFWGDVLLEDFAFYRADGSVFLSSVTHDGVCTLTSTDSESICEIVSNKGWHKVETPVINMGLPDVNAEFEFDRPMGYPVINGYSFSHITKNGFALIGYHKYESCNLSKRTAIGSITFVSPASHPKCLQVGERIRVKSSTQSGYATITAIVNQILRR